MVGWLCFLRHQWSNGVTCMVPNAVSDEFERRGWVKNEPDETGEGVYDSRLTELGTRVSDLNAPEWGIDPLAVETEA